MPADPQGKQQHVVETLNIIDKGTSMLIASHVRSDFTAETALQAVAQTFAEHGLPGSITLDRDTRWVGAPQDSDFPAALIRFCHCLGVAVVVCDPHHPQQNGFVDLRTYYVSSKLAGQPMTSRINATEHCLQVMHPQVNRRSLPLKGLHQRCLSYQDYVELMQREASTQQRLLALQKRRNVWSVFLLYTHCRQ